MKRRSFLKLVGCLPFAGKLKSGKNNLSLLLEKIKEIESKKYYEQNYYQIREILLHHNTVPMLFSEIKAKDIIGFIKNHKMKVCDHMNFCSFAPMAQELEEGKIYIWCDLAASKYMTVKNCYHILIIDLKKKKSAIRISKKHSQNDRPWRLYCDKSVIERLEQNDTIWETGHTSGWAKALAEYLDVYADAVRTRRELT